MNERGMLNRILRALQEAPDPVRGLTVTELQHRVGGARPSVDVAVKSAVRLGTLEHCGHVVKARPGLQPAKLYRVAGKVDPSLFHVEREQGAPETPGWKRGRAVDRMRGLLLTVSPDRGLTVGEMAELLEMDAKTVRQAIVKHPDSFVEVGMVRRRGVREAKSYGVAADMRRSDARPSRPLGGRPSTLQVVAA